MGDGDGSAGAAEPRSGRVEEEKPRAGRGRIPPADLAAFRRSVDAATRRAIVTPMIVLAAGAYFAAMIATGVPIRWPTAPELVQWGANDGARLLLRHEYWRLIASVFVHGGLLHLAVNMWSLLVIGPLVERIYGHVAFGVIYLAAGVGGAITSASVPPMRVSVGASGAICGILGGLLAFLVRHRRAIPPTVLRQLTRNVVGVVLFMAVLGALMSNIDQAAHLGGLATGFGCGLLLIGPWPVPPGAGPRSRVLLRRLALTAAIAAGLAGAAIVAANRGDAIISPARRLDDLAERLGPIIREFNVIRKDVARAIDRDGPGDEIAGQDRGLAALRALRARALANAAQLEAVRASVPTAREPELAAIQRSLSRAMDGQAARIVALARFLETGDRAALEAAREALVTSIEAIHECEDQRLRYLGRHGLILDGPDR